MQLVVGGIYPAKVVSVKKFGASVNTQTGESGMVHVSEITYGYVDDIANHLCEGQQVNVKLIKINEDGKLAFSIKQALPKPEKKDKKENGIIWQPKPVKDVSNMSFEDMLSHFRSQSEEKLSDYKKSKDVKRGGNSKKGK